MSSREQINQLSSRQGIYHREHPNRECGLIKLS
jgi:hypothetical protein